MLELRVRDKRQPLIGVDDPYRNRTGLTASPYLRPNTVPVLHLGECAHRQKWPRHHNIEYEFSFDTLRLL